MGIMYSNILVDFGNPMVESRKLYHRQYRYISDDKRYLTNDSGYCIIQIHKYAKKNDRDKRGTNK